MYWNRFDICEAYWHYAAEWHRGKWSAEYAIFGRLDALGFRMSPFGDKRHMTENGRNILANLIRRTRRGERPVRDV